MDEMHVFLAKWDEQVVLKQCIYSGVSMGDCEYMED